MLTRPMARCHAQHHDLAPISNLWDTGCQVKLLTNFIPVGNSVIPSRRFYNSPDILPDRGITIGSRQPSHAIDGHSKPEHRDRIDTLSVPGRPGAFHPGNLGAGWYRCVAGSTPRRAWKR